MRSNPLLRVLVILCLASSTGGCAAPVQNIKENGGWEQALASGNSSVVFGRIKWIEDGSEKKSGKGLLDFWISPTLLRIEDRSETHAELDEDGTFVWALEPGTYVINRINYRDTWSGNYFMVPKVAFRVPEKGRVYYVGTLRADFSSERDLIGGLSGRVRVTIEDHGRRDRAAILQHPGIANDFEKSLMVQDERLPRTIDTTEEFNVAVKVLNAVLLGLSY